MLQLTLLYFAAQVHIFTDPTLLSYFLSHHSFMINGRDVSSCDLVSVSRAKSHGLYLGLGLEGQGLGLGLGLGLEPLVSVSGVWS